MSNFGSSGELESIISITRSGEGFQYSAADEFAMEPYVSVFSAYLVSIISSALVLFMIVSYLNGRGAFNGLIINLLGEHEPVSPQTGVALSSVLAGVFGFIAVCIKRPRKALRNALKKRADSIISNANKEMVRLNELLSLGASMKAVGNDLHIYYPVDFKTEMIAFVGSHSKEILSNSAEFHTLIGEKLESAREEYANLSKARDLYASVKQYYEEIGHKVTRTRSKHMIYELGTYAEGLESDNLKAYIIQKQWDDFNAVMNMMKENLEELNDIASNHQEDTFYEYEEEQAGFKTPNELDKEQEAYKTLGLPPTATNEQIKKMRKQLAQAWHPDHNPELGDERLKKIFNAYDILKAKRNIK